MISQPMNKSGNAPLERVQQHPWPFLALALGTGLAVGALLRFKLARRALKFYLLWKRFV